MIKGTINKPLQFIDQLTAEDRIALFYEEPEYARMLSFRYIRNGLMNGERCLYLVIEDENDDKEIESREKASKNKNQVLDFVKREMIDMDIDVARFLAENLLYVEVLGSKQLIYHYDDKQRPKNPDIKNIFKTILPKVFHAHDRSKLQSIIHYRLVLDFKSKLEVLDQELLLSQIQLEQSYHPTFHTLQGSSICSYYVQNVEETLTDYSEHGKLTTIRLNNHNGVIFARQFGKGLALELK